MKKAQLSSFDHLLMYSPSSAKRKQFRTTQIIATVEAATAKEEIVSLIEAGMNIARFDGSKGKDDFKNIEAALIVFREAVIEYNEKRRLNNEKQNARLAIGDEGIEDCANVHVASAFDLKGSFYETGLFPQEVSLNKGGSVNLTTNIAYDENSNEQWIFVNYPKLLLLNIDQVIIVSEKIKLRVENVDEANLAVNCRVLNSGVMSTDVRHEVNLPGVNVDLDCVSGAVIPAINFCKKNNVDILIVPIHDSNSSKIIKYSVNPNGAAKALKVIAKLEGQEAVRQIDKIIERADGVMLSRSRLGRNMSPEQVIVYQKSIIAKCLKAGVPSIIACDILNSMKSSGGEGTRAEIADIVNMVLDGTDCVMLEKGVSTKDCIEVMQNTIMEAEDMINYRRLNWELLTQVAVPAVPLIPDNITNSIAIAACTAAMVNKANAIIVLTETGKSVNMISKYRPECPIIAVAKTPDVARQCLLYRGVFSINHEGEIV